MVEPEYRDSFLKQILIATDGSEFAKKAASFGIEIARLSGAKIYALYVIDVTPYYSIPLDQLWPKDVYEQFEKIGHEITADVEETTKAAELEVESIVLKGDPAERILNFAEEQNVDLIVVGAHGISKFERLIIGSVSEKIVRHAKIPVLVVREQKKQKNE